MTPASPLAALHPSNTLTYASLLAGMGAIAAALSGNAGAAGALIALSVIFDTFDGTFARRFVRTPQQRDLGVQLDSLSDAIAFGLAPVICAGMLSPSTVLAAFAYAACAITRLAFYNVTHEHIDGFIGLPVPVAALICSTALLANPSGTTITILIVAAAAAMVLPLPIPRPRGPGLAAFVAWPVIVSVAHLLPA